MSFFNRLTAVLVAAAMVGTLVPLEAKTRKGDKYLGDGRIHENKKEWDAALEDYEKALSEDPAEIVYQMAVQKARFQTSQMHLDNGLKLRGQGQLGEALLEFQKAYAIDPSSAVASQEVQLTSEMVARERKRVQDTGKEAPPAERALTPVEQVKKDELDKIDRILSVPELRPINPILLHLRIPGQKTKTVFESIAAYAGINVVWDPEYQPPQKDSISVDFDNTSLEQALDYVAVQTKSYWKALSPNTIFITNDNANKRRDYEEQVTKVFYLQNVATPAELQEIVNVIRTAADINRVFPYNSQFALVVRGEADRVELASKLIHDLDKPRSEVLVDILVMEASSAFSRQVTAAIASTGLNLPVNFSPRTGLQVQSTTAATSNSTNSTGLNNGTTTAATTGSSSSTAGTFVPLSNLAHLSSADFATTLPSALLQAAMSDTRTRVLQAPQIRAVDNQKATLKIGEREPTASGSFQPGIGGVGINPLVNTQFTYLDVGVNVDLLARIHDNNEVSMHIMLDISSVTGQVNLGGINEPIIGQRKVEYDLRMKEGQVGLLGGLINQEDDKTLTGIPGLSSIPFLGKLFSGSSTTHNRDELMIVVIPHILRHPEITPENLRPIAVGNATVIQLHHAPRPVPAGMADASPAGADSKGTPANANPAPAAVVPPAVAEEAAKAAELAPVVPSAPAPATHSAGPLPPATAPPLPPGMVLTPTGGGPAPQAAPAPPSDQPAAGPATVRFNPPTVQTTTGLSVPVAVVIEGGADVASAPMQIMFDPKILRLNSVDVGDFLSADGQQPVFTKNIMNDAGQATIQLNRLPGNPGVTGPAGTLVKLTFQAIGKGTATVSIPNLTVRNSQGATIARGNPQLTVTVN
ncbi:MAG TPA: cohesin domain-containing protein [Candidatus Sulfopaludibacter sp.]|jgi:general secretion pathway protein D|nr:cohesin domain-containing protein [Candidatus Sulfopaludibacter sp.]